MIYIGYEPREDHAYRVCRHSLLKRASFPYPVFRLDSRNLRKDGMFWRTWRTDEAGQMWDELDGKPFSTEFSYTRFLTPLLGKLEGFNWALFVDCDFLFLEDVHKLFSLVDESKAVMCVKHAHVPVETEKMDGCRQAVYPRKNWSSLVLFNVNHPSNRNLTLATVNTADGGWLHRFGWLQDHEIGEIPPEWNWIEGASDPLIKPAAVHYSAGGPWFPGYANCAYAGEWLAEAAEC